MIFDYKGVDLSQLKNYGFFQLSINDSAYLIACYVYNNSKAGKAHWKKEKTMPKYLFVKNPELQETRKIEAEKYHKTIIEAIESKELPASLITKDWQGEIIKHKTFIDTLDLHQWLKKRTPDYSDAVEEYYWSEHDLLINFLDTMPTVRLHTIDTGMFYDVVKWAKEFAKIRDDEGLVQAIGFENQTGHENLLLKQKLAYTENQLSDAKKQLEKTQAYLEKAQDELQEQGKILSKAQAKIDRLNEKIDNRERASLHKLFMGMAMSKKQFSKEQLLSDTGVTVKTIRGILNHSKLDLDDKTIGKYLGNARSTLTDALKKSSKQKE